MPRTARAPKGDGSREVRNRSRFTATIYETDRVPAAERPQIPRPPAGTTWVKQAVEWWKGWADSPQATLFEATDWMTLEKAMLAVHRWYETGDARFHQAIRLIEQQLGGTIGDRGKMGMHIQQGDRPADGRRPVAVVELSDPRKGRK